MFVAKRTIRPAIITSRTNRVRWRTNRVRTKKNPAKEVFRGIYLLKFDSIFPNDARRRLINKSSSYTGSIARASVFSKTGGWDNYMFKNMLGEFLQHFVGLMFFIRGLRQLIMSPFDRFSKSFYGFCSFV